MSRAGYTVIVYVLDISPSLGEPKADPGDTGRKTTRLGWVQEYVARMIEPRIQSGRKTEHVGVVTFGGRTNNQAHRAWMTENPDDEDPPYTAVSSEVAIQTAKPKALEVVVNLEVGEEAGNPISALLVALDMIRTHKHSKNWTLEVVLITDGESAFEQDEYEQAMELLDNLAIKLDVIGIDFQDPELPVEKDKSRNKRLSEKFWRAFVTGLGERISQTSDFEQFRPTLKLFDSELLEARKPHPAVVNGTVSGTHLFIGAEGIDPEQAIKIPIKYSKATMKARPPTLSKAWKAAVDLQAPTGASQLRSTLEDMQSQAASQHEPVPQASDLAALVSSDVKRHSMYVIKHKPEVAATQATQASQATQGSQTPASQALTQTQLNDVPEEEEEAVDKEDIVKAYRFGSSWVPIEDDTFEPLRTQKGVEILGFVPRHNIQHYMFIGEVRYMWPDLTSPKAQIQWSALVSALMTTDFIAIARWVFKDGSPPDVGACIPQQEFPGEGKKLDLMYWVKLPFADDDHKFFFPSLTKLKSVEGKEITEHPYLPTEEQCELMDELVREMDLDAVGRKPKKEYDSGDDTEEEEEEEGDMAGRWFDPARCYNPVIHRLKEAIFHASITADLKDSPLPPPHPDLVKYFNTPEEIATKVEKVTERLKDALDIKKVPPRTRKRVARQGFAEDEGFLDIDELFDKPPATQAKTGTQVKAEPESPMKDTKPKIEHDADPDFLPAPPAKPKPGRLVSNEAPLADFRRLVQGEGDVFRKAIQDLGAVVKENVAASFSHSAFPLALKCLEEMRATALTYEESETYNDVVDDLERAVKAKGFKHPDFWDHFDKAGKGVARISPEEAQDALEEYDE